MKSLVGILGLLLAFSATSYAIVCTYCRSSSTTCSGGRVTCPLGNWCGTSYTERVLEYATKVYRGCSTKSYCDLGDQSHNNVVFSCTSGGLSVHEVVLTPAIVFLLLLKIFF